jgi:hypothetical protein
VTPFTAETLRDLANHITGSLFADEPVSEHIVESEERAAVGYALVRSVTEWRSAHLVMVWHSTWERSMGIDTTDEVVIEVGDARLRFGDSALRIERSGPYAGAVQQLVEAWLQPPTKR